MSIANLRVAATNGRGTESHGSGTRPAAAVDDPANDLIAGWTPRRLKLDQFPDQAAGQGGIPPTIDNVRHLIAGNGIVARYNVIKKKTQIFIPGLFGVVENADNVSLAHVRSLMVLHGMAGGDARSIVDAIANENPYNPVADWIDSKPWDGVDRLPEFYATLTAIEEYPQSLKEALMRRWLLSAVAAALMPSGFSTRLVLTLQGPQSIGKTRWCISLVPDARLRSSVVRTDHHFDGGAKDNIITAARYWLVELGEVESSFRKDQERLKGIITRDMDTIRLPYGATDVEWPRRTVFMASANGSDFLNDPSGSTRWGVIAVDAVDYEHGIDMQQLLAQLAVAFRNGEAWWLDKSEEAALEAWNERHQATSLVRDAVLSVIDFEGDDTVRHERLTASGVLTYGQIEKPTQAQARECGGLLRARFGPPHKIKGTYYWNLPLRLRRDGPPAAGPAAAPARSKFD